MTDNRGIFRFRLYTQKKELSHLILSKNYFRKIKAIKQHSNTQALRKFIFIPIRAMELQKIVYRRKVLSLTCMYDIVFFQKKIYIISYI